VRLAANRTGEQSISVTDVLLVAVTETLRSHPDFNAHYVESEHIRYEDINLGVAVDSDEELVTPVVRNAQNRSLEALAAERRRLTDRVQRGEFTGDDLAGSIFTVTNLGMFGVYHFDPVLNPPEVGILGVGRIRPDGQMTLSLSFDHRVVNGADAGRFLETRAGYLTDDSKLIAITN
jgi:pyruvate dehydrogenase E2 component (dihydrolipoamide acetyltransferase)